MQICNTKRRAYLHCSEITFADRVAVFCSFFAITGRKCGRNRGWVDFVCLNSCNADISSHLMKGKCLWNGPDTGKGRSARTHWWSDQEYDGLSSLSLHFGKILQAPKTCQYPKHHGKKMAIAKQMLLISRLQGKWKISLEKPFPLARVSTIRLATITVLLFHFILTYQD